MIKPGELAGRLALLDIDEGIRFERGREKIFVNRNPSGIFVVQLGDSHDFRYLGSAGQVTTLVKKEFGSKAVAWMY